ncbi:MAG: GNAT family N-acetyltransferase [Caldilineaceae bacterium]
MATNITSLASPHLLASLESNMVAFWKAYGFPAGRQLDERSDRLIVMTGIPEPLFNAVYRAHFEPGGVAGAIEEIRLHAARWNVPLFWWLTPTTTPPNLGDTLLKHGFIHAGSVPGMAVDLARLDSELALPRGLTIKVVEDEAALDVWAEIAAVGTGFAPPVAAMVRRLELEVGLRPLNGLRRYMGYLDGIPVAVSGLVLHAGVAGIFAVATLPQARGQGIGSALTRIPLLDALAGGYRVGTLQASEMGYPVYKKLGFETVCGLELYLLASGAPMQ